MARETSRRNLVFGWIRLGSGPRSSHTLQRQGSEAAGPFWGTARRPGFWSGCHHLGSSSVTDYADCMVGTEARVRTFLSVSLVKPAAAAQLRPGHRRS